MNLKVQLNSHEDKHGNLYFVGKIYAPIALDLSKGAAFLIFTSEQDAEELQIANLDEEANLSNHFLHDDKIKVKLEKRLDSNKQPYFLAKIRDNLMVEPEKERGLAFVIFTSKEGKEELQIGGKVGTIQSHPVEIISKRSKQS